MVVENGPGIGCFEPSPDVTVLQSPKHQSLAKNAGLQHLRSIGAEYWACFDCDDYYGPEYLAEMEQNRSKAVVLGKIMYYLRMEDGTLFVFNESHAPGFALGVWGATIGCRVDRSPDFEVVPTGEEDLWLRRFRQTTGIYNTGPDNFIHLRWKSGHTTQGMTRSQFSYMRRDHRVISRFRIPANLSAYADPIYQVKP